jgi:ABC-type lipoprotein export system ATPase subunit
MIPLRCDKLSCILPGGSPSRELTAAFTVGSLWGFCGPDSERLLNVLGVIDRPQRGRLEVLGMNVLSMSDPSARAWRDRCFGFLFAHPHLLPSFTVAENVAMPFFRLCSRDPAMAKRRTMEILDFMGISELESSAVGDLDQSAVWRVSMARAIVHRPAILVAITPPDPQLLPIARRLADEAGTTILWNGERHHLSRHADSILDLEESSALAGAA